jgi:hypothetical protein
MDDRLLGAILWQFGKWWIRRRLRHNRRKAAILGLCALAVLGLLASQRQASQRQALDR